MDVLLELLGLPEQPLLDVLGVGQGAQPDGLGLLEHVAAGTDRLLAQGCQFLLAQGHLGRFLDGFGPVFAPATGGLFFQYPPFVVVETVDGHFVVVFRHEINSLGNGFCNEKARGKRDLRGK
jgi:hypothetical protein